MFIDIEHSHFTLNTIINYIQVDSAVYNSYCNEIYLANAIFIALHTWNRVECLIGVYITLNCQFFQYSWCATKNYHILYVRRWKKL